MKFNTKTLKATLMDEQGHTVEYEPLAFMLYNGENILVLKATGDSGLNDDILLLHQYYTDGDWKFDVIEDKIKYEDLLQKSLGIMKPNLN